MVAFETLAPFLGLLTGGLNTDQSEVIITHPCDQKVYLFPDSMTGIALDLTRIVAAADAFSDAIKSRAKCQCPSLSDEDYNLLFDPTTALVNALSANPKFVTIPSSCSKSFVFNLQTLIGVLNFDRVPDTLSYDQWIGSGKSVALKFPVAGFDLSAGISLWKCPNSNVPGFALTCSGGDCKKFMKPCTSDSTCGTLKCYDATAFMNDLAMATSDLMIEAKLATAPKSCMFGSASPNRNNDIFLSIYNYIADNVFGGTNALTKFKFCGGKFFNQTDLSDMGNQILNSIGATLSEKPDVCSSNSALQVNESIVNLVKRQQVQLEAPSLSTTRPSSKAYATMISANRAESSEMSTTVSLNLGLALARELKKINITLSLPWTSWNGVLDGKPINIKNYVPPSPLVITNDPTKQKIVELTCDLKASVMNIINFRMTDKTVDLGYFALELFKRTQDCRGSSPLAWDQFIGRFGLWNPAMILSLIQPDLDFDFGPAFSSFRDLFTQTSGTSQSIADILSKIKGLPDSCSRDSWLTEGSCEFTWNGLSSLFKLDLGILVSVSECPSTETRPNAKYGLPRISITCTGADCVDFWTVTPKFCTTDSDCRTGFVCYDEGARLQTVKDFPEDPIGQIVLPYNASLCANTHTPHTCSSFAVFKRDLHNILAKATGQSTNNVPENMLLKRCGYDVGMWKDLSGKSASAKILEDWVGTLASVTVNANGQVSEVTIKSIVKTAEKNTTVITNGGSNKLGHTGNTYGPFVLVLVSLIASILFVF